MTTVCEEIRIPLRLGYITGCWYGNRAERPILALHGWQDNAGSFALLAPLLSKHVAILAIDLPGHGRSSHNPPGIAYNTLAFVRCIKEIMMYFNWPKISLMGHSMGAAISYHFTSLFPHLVDTLISIDVMHTRYHSLSMQVDFLGYSMDKFNLETERKLRQSGKEPPAQSFNRLQEILHEASENSIDKDKTKYILQRNTKQSSANRDLFYFSRDGSVKYMQEYNTEPGLCLAMAQRMTNLKWLVLKAHDSYHIDEELPVTKQIVESFQQNNPNFSYYSLPYGKHHCHLNNAEMVAEYILPFLAKHRQPEPCVITKL